jgi:hypothetical protein
VERSIDREDVVCRDCCELADVRPMRYPGSTLDGYKYSSHMINKRQCIVCERVVPPLPDGDARKCNKKYQFSRIKWLRI